MCFLKGFGHALGQYTGTAIALIGYMSIPIFMLMLFFGNALSGEPPHSVTPPSQSQPPRSVVQRESNSSPPQYSYGDSLSFSIIDPSKAQDSQCPHPWFRLFPGNKDALLKDASSPLGTIKYFRGKSKCLPQEDRKEGLIVILQGMSFVPSPDGQSYLVRIYGEKNAAEYAVSREDIESLFQGKTIDLKCSNRVSGSTGMTRYNVDIKMTLRLAIEDKNLYIYALKGEGSIEAVGFWNSNTYHSRPVDLTGPSPTQPLYNGTPAELPDLRIIR
ncbi:MAG: hypothetical protein HY537_00950 [Deltaproteobacteria bacterium]|nr:hypothetical protein [Deltaproteobacteria bacterium]